MLLALFAPLIAPYDPKDYNPAEALLKPSFKHLLGTDTVGADIFAQLIYGTRLSLVIGIVTGILTTLIGAFMGVMAGYFGKKHLG